MGRVVANTRSARLHFCNFQETETGARGLRSAEQEYRFVKTKEALTFYKNPDPAFETVKKFEQRACKHLFMKDAKTRH